MSPRFHSSVIDQMLTRGQITRVSPNRAPVVRRANVDGLVAPITDLPDVLEQLGHLLFGDRTHVDTSKADTRHWKCLPRLCRSMTCRAI